MSKPGIRDSHCLHNCSQCKALHGREGSSSYQVSYAYCLRLQWLSFTVPNHVVLQCRRQTENGVKLCRMCADAWHLLVANARSSPQ